MVAMPRVLAVLAKLFGLAMLALSDMAGTPVLARELTAAERQRLDARFHQWLAQELRGKARQVGASPRLVDHILQRVKPQWRLPDLALPGRPFIPPQQRQAEFSAPARYFRERSLQIHARTGRRLARRHAALLRRIEQRYGVPGEIVLAIWARESNFGRVKIAQDAFSILATQAFAGRRKAYFRQELAAALRMVASGAARLDDMKSSWAGVLGQPQFMPTVFLKHAVDFNGDGRRDIWRSVPDVLASIANHLKQHGWRRGVRWGVEVRVPVTVGCHLEGPDQGQPLAVWRRMGIARIDGRPFPPSWRRQKEIYLLMPAGRYGAAFLVSANFYVLKEYNMSDLYALFVGHLGDRIAGRAVGPFQARWGKVGHLLRADVACMQARLEKMGHDVGGVDGLPGFRTRRSIGRHEQALGLRPSCFPTEKLRKLLCGR